MRQFPFHKIVLVLGKDTGPGEEKAEAVASEIRSEFEKVAEIEEVHVELDEIYHAAITIAEKIRAEEKLGNTVLVNASGSLRTVGISCYLACAVTGATLYVALPAYEDDQLTGIRQVQVIPPAPLKDAGTEEQSILKYLLEHGRLDSVDTLIQGLRGLEKKSQSYQKERARMSYHIKKLRENGFIETSKDGKNLKIALTPLGRLISVGKS
jgi:DNA-binding transcriptional ArsR family regulator